MAFHWSKVICFSSSSLAALASSSSAVSSLGALGSSSAAASSLPSESTVVFASSPSLGTSSSKVPQLPLPPPPRLSSALIPVLLSPDFLSKSLLPPQPTPSSSTTVSCTSHLFDETCCSTNQTTCPD